MAKKQTKKPAKKTQGRAKLGWIGVWATIWWGVSCAYVLLLVWAARDDYAALSTRSDSAVSFSRWQSAIASAYHASAALPAILGVILAVWLAGGWIWLRELKRQNVSYGAAFKDLFLTIRK